MPSRHSFMKGKGKTMKEQHNRHYSRHLQREMEMSIYGHAGKPCLVFPPQDGKHGDWKAFGMIDAMADYINDGRIQVFCCDSIDEETWSNQYGDPRQRIERQEAYFNYICEELVDWILDINEADCGLRAGKLMTTGASMGGYYAVNCMMRRPDLFDKVLSLSGLFQSDYFFHDYHDDLTYANSPLNFLQNMPLDHPYIRMYNESEIILCCGQGAWEEQMIDHMHRMQDVFARKGIEAWIDFWGYDVNHDWPWWRRQIVYFLQFLV